MGKADTKESVIDLSDRTNMFYWQTNRRISARQQKDIFLTRHARLKEELLRQAVAAGMKRAGFLGDDTIVAAHDPILALGSVNTVVPISLKSGREIVIRMHPPEVRKLGDWKEKLALLKLRYLVSKLHLRKKRSLVEDSEFLARNITRGLEAMKEVFTYFRVS